MKRKLYSLSIVLASLVFSTPGISGQELPEKGDLIITEFMANPASVSDSKGEWLELMNISEKELLLNGLIIKDDGSNSYVIEDEGSITLDAGSVFLMGRSMQNTENGGISPDFQYKDFTLSNTEDEIILCLPDETILDQISYDSTWDIEKGISLELNPSELNSSLHNNQVFWRLAKLPYGLGDLGSPGFINSNTSNIVHEEIVDRLLVYPNPCFGKLNIEVDLKAMVDINISLINLTGQVTDIIECPDCDKLVMDLETDWLEKGLWIIRLELGNHTEYRKVLLF